MNELLRCVARRAVLRIRRRARFSLLSIVQQGGFLRHFVFHLLLDAQRHLLQGEFAQLQDVLLPEEVAQGGRHLVGFVDFTRFEPFDQFVGRQVDVHHLVGRRQHAVGHPFVDFDAGDLLHLFVHPFDVLDVDGRDDADTRVEDLHHVLPPFGICAALDVGVRQFVDHDDIGVEVDDGLHIHLFELLALVEELAARNERKPFGEGFRFGTAVRLDVTDLDVHACVEQLVRLLQHAVGLAHAGTHADVDLEFPAVRGFDQGEKVLGASPGVLCIHSYYILNENPPTKLTSSRAGFQIRLVKIPIFMPSAPLMSQVLPALRKTFCT